MSSIPGAGASTYVYKGAGFEVGGKAFPATFRLSSEIQAGIRSQFGQYADRFANVVVQYTDSGTIYVTGTSTIDRRDQYDIVADVMLACGRAGLNYKPGDFGILLHNNVKNNPYAARPQDAPEATRAKELDQEEKTLKTLKEKSSLWPQFKAELEADLKTTVWGVPVWAIGAVALATLAARRL